MRTARTASAMTPTPIRLREPSRPQGAGRAARGASFQQSTRRRTQQAEVSERPARLRPSSPPEQKRADDRAARSPPCVVGPESRDSRLGLDSETRTPMRVIVPDGAILRSAFVPERERMGLGDQAMLEIGMLAMIEQTSQNAVTLVFRKHAYSCGFIGRAHAR